MTELIFSLLILPSHHLFGLPDHAFLTVYVHITYILQNPYIQLDKTDSFPFSQLPTPISALHFFFVAITPLGGGMRYGLCFFCFLLHLFLLRLFPPFFHTNSTKTKDI